MSLAAGAMHHAPHASPDPVRSTVYSLLSRAYSFPEPSLLGLKEGQFSKLAAALARLPYRLRTSDLSWRVPATDEDLESEYIRLFQIGGRRGPPCPLHGGFYDKDRSRMLQQLIRYYNFFGFGLSECVMPDHLSVQLEFISRLAGGGVSDYWSRMRAQRDFLTGPLAWVGPFAERVRSCRPVPFYRSLTTLTARLIEADRIFIQRHVSSGADYGHN